jgi:hypothetical protein
MFHIICGGHIVVTDYGSTKEKKGKFRICVDFKRLNLTIKKNLFSISIHKDEILNIMAGCETYSFLDGYFGYHQISITLENRF